MKKLLCLMPYALCFALCACGGTRARLDTLRNDYANGDFCGGGARFVGRTICNQEPHFAGAVHPHAVINHFNGLGNLEILVAGDILFQADEFPPSDAAFENFNRRNINKTGGSITAEAARLVGGGMANDYRPSMMDGLFVSYYQLLGALADGRNADARVIINQSYVRQVAMSREFARMIRTRQESGNRQQQNEVISRLSENEARWTAFSDIMNPALTYMAGIYFLNQNDFPNARTYLERARGMMPRNRYIATDLAAAKARRRPDGIAWVLIESGFSPRLIESRFDFPLIINGRIQMISIATSRPQFLPDAPRFANADILTDVDSMFMTEYSEYRVNDVVRSIAAATSRQFLQVAANNQDPLLGLASTLFSVATTQADIRSWATLPKRIWLVRINKRDIGMISSEINVPRDGNHLIYIRWFGNRLVPKVIKL